MIILPDRNVPRAKLLMPMVSSGWRTPSQAQFKNILWHENQTRFRLCARLNDGHVAWTGWFDDRGDADAFLWALARGSLRYERELWDLPTPAWRPDIAGGADIGYDFATVVFIVSGVSYSVPADCTGVASGAGEFIDTLGGGASGAPSTGANRSCGSGGGACSRIVSLVLTPSSSVTIQIGVGGAAKVGGGNGNSGTDTWFNGASLAASSVGAKAGVASTSGGGTGGAGGAAASGIGTTKFSGGKGGNTSSNNCTSGAGGAAGPTSNGVDGTAGTVPTTPTAGGAGGTPSGGAGGAPALGPGPITSDPGGNGTGYDATHGSGGGSGGGVDDSGAADGNSGNGGNYGGGSGGCQGAGATSGAAGPGLTVVSYNPVSATGGKKAFNMPMMGM